MYRNHYDLANRSYEMCGLTEADVGINGIYYSNQFYCVWLEGRTMEEVNKTECHEMCHHFVYNDYEHFCGDD